VVVDSELASHAAATVGMDYEVGLNDVIEIDDTVDEEDVCWKDVTFGPDMM
jgi:hypothetical protein